LGVFASIINECIKTLTLKIKIMKLEKLKLLVMLLVLAIIFAGCKQNNVDTDLLTDEEISFNLLETGKIDPALLIGEWNIIKFAYTSNGHRIRNVVDIPIDPDYDIAWIASHNGISINEAIDAVTPKLKIPDPPITPPKNEWDYWDDVNEHWVTNANVCWHLSVCNSSTWICSLSDNLINLKCYGSTLKGCSNSAENDIAFALSNAYSFVVKGNELIIYFKTDGKQYGI